jgi:phenylpyruvate tautomerase PptA (4-oxalocrotonate tautomerase family)
MPHLQLDVPKHYPLDIKKRAARRIGEKYAEVMQTTPDLVDVTIRDLGEGSVWRCSPPEPSASAVLTLAIRRGRPAEQRARLAEALMDICVEEFGLDPLYLSVEFNYHAGEDIYRKAMVDGTLQGGLGRDWSPSETTTPLIETLIAEKRKELQSKAS